MLGVGLYFPRAELLAAARHALGRLVGECSVMYTWGEVRGCSLMLLTVCLQCSCYHIIQHFSIKLRLFCS